MNESGMYLGNKRSESLTSCAQKQENQRTKEVPDSLSRLGDSLAILQDELQIMYGILSPIIRQEPQPDTPPECTGGNCELSRRLNDATAAVRRITNDVITVRNALEV